MAIRRRLGRTQIEVTAVGLGCWQFSAGRGMAGKFWEALPQDSVNRAVAVALQRGINWFDTAEMYGHGASERALAAALLAAGKASGDIVVATKWMPIFRTAGSIKATIGERLRCLAPFAIDLETRTRRQSGCRSSVPQVRSRPPSANGCAAWRPSQPICTRCTSRSASPPWRRRWVGE